jgi:hypothetical protein
MFSNQTNLEETVVTQDTKVNGYFKDKWHLIQQKMI